MGHDLQAPGTDNAPNWDSLYRYRGPDEVVPARPILTGDVFVDVPVADDDRLFNLAVLQHPCAIRRGTLNKRILCAEVVTGAVIKPSKWATSSYRIMPLPELRPGLNPPHYEVRFEDFHIAESEQLLAADRIACLDLVGIDLFLQRWVHHNSRVVVPTSDYLDATVGQYAEADILEEWCLERQGVSIEGASAEADDWLAQADALDKTRRDRLREDEYRARIRREARVEVQRLNSAA